MVIKLARVKMGLTIEELAEKLGINKNTLMKYEKGNYGDIKLKTAKRIVEVLGISLEELLIEV